MISPSTASAPSRWPRTAASRWRGALWLAIAGFSLWLRSGFPLVALGGAGADDALFIRLAQSLAQGEWLGRYDNLTLAKGMFYPLFIAATAFTGLPLHLAEQAVYLAVAAATARFVGRRGGGPWLALALFAVLALNPVFWDAQLARVIREGLYISLSLAVVALATAVGFSAGSPRRLAAGAGLGLVAAAFWLTREEGLWLAPALAVVGIGALADAALAPGGRVVRRVAGRAAPFAVAALVFAGAVGAVAGLNRRYYGVSVTSEFKSTDFQRAYAALAGIKQDEWRRYVVFPHDARARSYAVSPAARELAPFFEGDGGESWRRIGCASYWIDRSACGEILAGWFMWALRDAVTAAGHTGSGRDAELFYRRLADEIDAACDDGRLECAAPHRATLAPPFRWGYVADAWRVAGTLVRIVLTAGGGNRDTPASEGTVRDLAAFADMAGPIAPAAGMMQRRLVGWVAAAGGLPTLAVRSGPGVEAAVQNIRSGADIERMLPGLTALRFELVTGCPADCALMVVAPGTATVVLPWAALATGTAIDAPGERLFLETVATYDRSAMAGRRMGLQRWCAAQVYRFYRGVFPVLVVLGVGGLALTAIRRRGLPAALFVLGVASLAAVVCRVALLAYLDVTSLPAANSLYASPASPFVILVMTLGVRALVPMGLRERTEGPRPRRPARRGPASPAPASPAAAAAPPRPAGS